MRSFDLSQPQVKAKRVVFFFVGFLSFIFLADDDDDQAGEMKPQEKKKKMALKILPQRSNFQNVFPRTQPQQILIPNTKEKQLPTTKQARYH